MTRGAFFRRRRPTAAAGSLSLSRKDPLVCAALGPSLLGPAIPMPWGFRASSLSIAAMRWEGAREGALVFPLRIVREAGAAGVMSDRRKIDFSTR